MEKKNNSKVIIILLVGIILIVVGAFLFMGSSKTDSEKEKKDDQEQKDNKVGNNELDKYEGIYVNENDKMYIYKTSDSQLHYMIGGNFEGSAKLDGDIVKQYDSFNNNEYFAFKLVEDGIELSYVTDQTDVSVAVETGKYKRVADYSKDNVYTYAVGDPSYLTSNYSGLYKSGEIVLYVYQTDEKHVNVNTSSDTDVNLSEIFEIKEDKKIAAKSFFDEKETAYEITYGDKTITLDANENVFGFDEEKKQLEQTYTFVRELNKEEIVTEFYRNY